MVEARLTAASILSEDAIRGRHECDSRAARARATQGGNQNGLQTSVHGREPGRSIVQTLRGTKQRPMDVWLRGTVSSAADRIRKKYGDTRS